MRGGRLQVRLIGPVRVLRDDQPVPLPRSRKVLALLGYLALESEPQSRSRLCDLLWDGPNDPRGELRWCLSKLRALVDDDDRQRVITSGALVTLDLSDAAFDAAELELSPDRQRQMDLALETAAESLATDERDPSAHWAMGRALWLRGEGPASIAELERSIELSPNYALGHYTLGFVQAQSGDPHAAIRASDTSRALSPFDPLQFGMLGSLALAHLRLGQLDAATHSALAAIARPNAHVHILAIAACILALGGRRDEARALVGRARQHTPGYDLDHFLRAFHFDRDADDLFRQGAKTIGL